MEIEKLVEELLKIKEKYPNLSNIEITKLMELKIAMEANSRNNG